MKSFRFLILVFFFFIQNACSIERYFCTASNDAYFKCLINLIGSIYRVYPEGVEKIAVFDLGLRQEQRDMLNRMENVQVYDLERTHPDILKPVVINDSGRKTIGWYAWKFVVWKQMLDMFPHALWVDAGTTIMNNIDNLFRYIEREGYFISTIGGAKDNGSFVCSVRSQTTRKVLEHFMIDSKKNKWILDEEGLMTGVVGFSQKIKKTLIKNLYEYTKNLKWFEDDGSAPGGFGNARYEQAIFSIYVYLNSYQLKRQDFMQRNPIDLNIDGKKTNLYLTWDKRFIAWNQTHIYSSRGDMIHFDHFLKQIQYVVPFYNELYKNVYWVKKLL